MKLNLIESLVYLTVKLLKSIDKRETGLESFAPETVKSILVVSSTAIGDTLLSTPAIRAVRERYPQARITAHFNKKNMELFDNNPDIDGIIPYRGGYRKFLKTIMEFRRHKFDLALIFHGNEPQATPMAYLSGARFIIKMSKTRKYQFLLSNQFVTFKKPTHVIEKRLKVAEMVGCKTNNKRMLLPELKEGPTVIDRFFKIKGIKDTDILIGFQVGASTMERVWTADRFIELGKKLLNFYPQLKIVITGSPQEYNYCKKITDGIGEKTVISAGHIPLKYLTSLLMELKVLVSGDTGTMHMAVAIGTPVIALFVSADPGNTGPYYDLDKHTVIRKEKPCSPCISRKCKRPFCMESINIEEVFEAFKETLK
ncbi:MAG TPA: glycosyltransferase family 9 protein [Nitrospirae bacterium]|nr:glycosyltransferase family 9 protein [Nitrospirota bacterium]